MIMVGIDPGVRTGFAIWDSTQRKLLVLKTTTFWECIEEIDVCKTKWAVQDFLGYKFYIEAPQAIKPIFGDKSKFGGALGSTIAQRVGENKCMAKLIIKYLEKHKLPFSAVPPIERKLDQESFKKMTKWEKQTDQHRRDAGWLVYGR
jgi:hypothetical protein